MHHLKYLYNYSEVDIYLLLSETLVNLFFDG